MFLTGTQEENLRFFNVPEIGAGVLSIFTVAVVEP
jgi:hypothetical protein